LRNVIFYSEDGTLSFNTEVLDQHSNPLKEFYLKYMGGPVENEDNTMFLSMGYEEETLMTIMLYTPQNIYRSIVDKAVAGTEMTEEELKLINQGISGGDVFQHFNKEKNRFVLKRVVYFGPFGIIKALHEFVYDISSQRVEIGRCELEDCENIFLLGGSGSKKRFCRNSHRVRSHQLKKSSV